MTEEFEQALRHVTHDIKLDEGGGADLVAVGVDHHDCVEFLHMLIKNEPRITAELLAVIVQMAVAVGVWLERERWQPSSQN